MEKKFLQTLFFYVLSLFVPLILNAQKKNSFALGFNITHFSDWANKPINFFNPELRYSKFINASSSIDAGFNALYSPGSQKDYVVERLIFTTDFAYKRTYNRFSGVIGPSFRYRNERINSCGSCPFWDSFRPKKSFFDFGGLAGLNYQVISNLKSSVDVRFAYRFYNQGVNPVSLGIFYSRNF